MTGGSELKYIIARARPEYEGGYRRLGGVGNLVNTEEKMRADDEGK